MAEPTSAPTGYRLVLPSDWVQIPLRTGEAEQVARDIVTEAFARVPADVPRDKLTPLRLELERRLLAAVADARRAEALELYLPMRLSGEVNLGASIIVSETRLPTRSDESGTTGAISDPAEVAAQLMSRDGGSNIDLSSGEVDGALAVRRERVVPAAPDRGVEMDSRRVDYFVSVPGDPGRWFVAAFSTIGAGSPRDDLADALVEWFDALMTTFRWSWK
ncbi:hypothetical protein [Streptomyces sp. P17]|uniref:hypothetical protein n=1 Tax=Streptomyces sp. P17 TaxID=3074716 RepID=UPI0028F438D9|nr:hypothetical protein [Streptomyces sp. P17]MDT9697171.1 hypothetical protein [Streptomyces sp. P17]